MIEEQLVFATSRDKDTGGTDLTVQQKGFKTKAQGETPIQQRNRKQYEIIKSFLRARKL